MAPGPRRSDGGATSARYRRSGAAISALGRRRSGWHLVGCRFPGLCMSVGRPPIARASAMWRREDLAGMGKKGFFHGILGSCEFFSLFGIFPLLFSGNRI